MLLKLIKVFFDSWNRHIILNLLWKTYFKCILLSDYNNIVVIRPTNKRAQIASPTNNLVWCSKKIRALVRGKKTSSQSCPCELDKGHSLWKINCSLWPCKDVSNKLLCFSWHNYIVVDYIKSIKSIYANIWGFFKSCILLRSLQIFL